MIEEIASRLDADPVQLARGRPGPLALLRAQVVLAEAELARGEQGSEQQLLLGRLEGLKAALEICERHAGDFTGG